MAGINTTSSLSQEMAIVYDKVFLERLQLETCYDFLTSKRNIAKNSGKTVYFTRQTAFTPTSASLTEGTTPTVSAFSATTVSCTVAAYGKYSDFTDLFSLTTIDAGLKEKVDTFGQYAAETMDLVRLNTMVAGATTRFANAKTPAASNPLTALLSTDTFDVADLRYVVLNLKKQKAPKFGAPVGALNMGGAYRGVMSSQAYYDLLGDSTTGAFTAITIATSDDSKGTVQDQSIKRLAGVDIKESNNMYTEVSAGAGAITELAYSNLFAGKDAVIEVDVAGSGSPQVIYKQSGSETTSDPLNLTNTLAWKVNAWGCVVANSNWLWNIKSYGT